MTEQEKKLIDAAKSIREYCTGKRECENCVFDDESGNCTFWKTLPESWRFPSERHKSE